jgi:hypothetical protein
MESMTAWQVLYFVPLLEIINADSAYLIFKTIPAHITHSACLNIVDLFESETSIPLLIEELVWLGI